MQNIIYPQGRAEIVIPATESIAIFTEDVAAVSRYLGYPNFPAGFSPIGTVSRGQTVFGAYSAGATIAIDAGAARVYYEVGVAPVCSGTTLWRLQGTPGVLNATGALTAAMMLSGIVTSTSAAAVAGTIPTGTTLDLASEFAVGDSFEWSVINTGPNTFTVTAASGHTIVGAAAVATATSAKFSTAKTAANTFVTYRLS